MVSISRCEVFWQRFDVAIAIEARPRVSLSTLLMARDAAKVVGLSAFEWSLKANDSDPLKTVASVRALTMLKASGVAATRRIHLDQMPRPTFR